MEAESAGTLEEIPEWPVGSGSLADELGRTEQAQARRGQENLRLLPLQTMTTATQGGDGLFGLYIHITVQRKSGQELKQGRNLEAGADAEAMEECCLLMCFLWLIHPAFL